MVLSSANFVGIQISSVSLSHHWCVLLLIPNVFTSLMSTGKICRYRRLGTDLYPLGNINLVDINLVFLLNFPGGTH